MIKKIGTGEFGDIYEGVTGQEAVDFLLQNGSGEVLAALYNKETQIFVDIIYGKGGKNGYGLIHIKEKHPECVLNLEEIVLKGSAYKMSKNRIQLKTITERGEIVSVIRLEFERVKKNWLLTTFIT